MNNQKKKSWRLQINEIAWLATLFALMGAAIALRYVTGLPGTQWWQYLYVFGAAAGVFILGTSCYSFCLCCRWHAGISKQVGA